MKVVPSLRVLTLGMSGYGPAMNLLDLTTGMIPHNRLPKDGDDVTIGCGFGVLLRSSPPSLGHLTVRGTLEVVPQ